MYQDIKCAIKSCSTNLFVFDEIQYMPMGMLDILIPILENHDVSIDSRYILMINLLFFDH